MGDTSNLTPSTRRTPDLRGMILTAMGELLAERRLEEITVLDLTERAQVSRASFYVYFESKYAPLAALAEQVTDGIYRDCWAPFVAGEESPSLETYGDHLLETIELWDQHRAVLVAAAAAWRADPAAIGGWEALWSRYVDGQRGLIERARSRGEAPDGLDAQTLAAALTWMHENALYLAFIGAVPEFRDHRRLAETQSTIWWRAIFGG